ncbi:cyclin dependent kinase-5 activator [Anaeramoeba flamelloides]|uniref:Cyclin dependent kinase-5 activator n=1 Tax=Anaeramoeba flamelloides TaxID=1746091 RepID=A0ABQ8Y2V9_9EUKA|nr:cyclin dependent kinase-5 activator [Anaeramoeba flamelloides]
MGNIETLPVVAKKYQNFEYGLLKNTKKAFCVCDESTTILDANDNFAKLFKTEKQSLISTKLISPNINQKQYSLSSLDFIKMVSSHMNNIKGSQTYQCCFQRPNKEFFYASTQICLGNLNGKLVFRAIIKEISDPTLIRFDQFLRGDEDGTSINMVDIHLKKIKNALFNSKLGDIQMEKDLIYHLYCISQQSRLNQITNNNHLGKIFTVLILRKKNVEEVAHLTISRGKLNIQTLKEQKEIDDKNEIILQIHTNRSNLLKLEYPDDQLTLAFPSEYVREKFINTLKFAFDPNYEPFFDDEVVGIGMEEDEDEDEDEDKNKEGIENDVNKEEVVVEDEEINVSLIKKAFSSKNPKSVSCKNPNISVTKSIGGLLNSKIDVIGGVHHNNININNVRNVNRIKEESYSKKEYNLTINKKQGENEERIDIKNEEKKTKKLSSNTMSNQNEIFKNMNQNNNTPVTKGKDIKEMGGQSKEHIQQEEKGGKYQEYIQPRERENFLFKNRNESKNEKLKTRKLPNFSYSDSHIISQEKNLGSLIQKDNEFTQEFGVFVKKPSTNVLERGMVYLGGGVLKLKTKTITEILRNAKEEIKVSQDDMWYRKVTIEFLKKQTLYFVTFNETETANEFLKYYQELIIDFDYEGGDNSLNNKDETLLQFLKASGDGDLPVSNNNEASETMSMFEFLTLSEGWELHNINNANNSPKMSRRDSNDKMENTHSNIHNDNYGINIKNNNELIKKCKSNEHRTEFNVRIHNGSIEKSTDLTIKLLKNKYLLFGKKKILIKKIIIHQQQSLPKVCQIEVIKNKRRRKRIHQNKKIDSMDSNNMNKNEELDLNKVPIGKKINKKIVKKNNKKKIMVLFLTIEEKNDFIKEFNYISENFNNFKNKKNKSKKKTNKKKITRKGKEANKDKETKETNGDIEKKEANKDKEKGGGIENEGDEQNSNKKKGTTLGGIFKRKESRKNAKGFSRNRTRSFSMGRTKRPIFENKNINGISVIPNLISVQTVRNLYQNNNDGDGGNGKNKRKDNGNNNVSLDNNNLSDSLIIEGETIQEIEEFTLKIFTYKQEWVTGKIQFLENNEIVLITPEKKLSSSQGNVFRLILHPTRKKISKLKIDLFNFILKFNSSIERENFSNIFERQYLSNKKLFEIMIFWSNIQNKEIKRLNAKIRIHHEELIINTINNRTLTVPIVKDLKISLNPTRKTLIKIDLPNAEFCVLSFSEHKELSVFVKILKKIMLIL